MAQMGDRGYYVRLAPSTPSMVTGTRAGLGRDTMHFHHHRRRRFQFHVPASALVVLAIAGWFGWAQMQEGGARHQIQHAIDEARGAVENATTDPGMKRAALYFNEQYARDGHYTQMTDTELRDDAAADWGVGVTVNFCNDQAMVLQSLTGAGTSSRLLLRGVDLGDALGEHGCPLDYTNPLPWKLRTAG
jgi:hypothetical protein